MSTFVLVHGSFQGGWCWNDVAAGLRESGHEVHTPTLTGLGERYHLVSPRVGLSDNVLDVANTIDARNLEDVVLVGHSYGCMVISGVAEHVGDQLDRMIYLDGYMPEDGQSCWDITPDAQDTWESRTAETGTDWLVPPPDPGERFGETGTVADWHRQQMTPMSLWTHEETIHLPNDRARSIPRSYICCTDYEVFLPMADKAQQEGLDYYELGTHHVPVVYSPELVVDVFRSIVE